MNRELKQHISILERANDEYKRITRKREKEFDQMKTESEQNLKNSSALNTKVFD